MKKTIDANEQIPAGTQVEQPAAELSQQVYEIDPTTVEIDVHPLAAAFPDMEGVEFDQLKSSMEKGQQNPIIMDGNIILDGINRLNACRELGIPVKAIQWNGSGTVEELILAQNLRRRNLTASQRAAIATKLLPAIELEAEERMNAGTSNPSKKKCQGKSVDIAGKQFGVSGIYVDRANKIAKASEEIFQELLSGKLTLAQAAREVKAATAPVQQPDQQTSQRYSLFEAIKEIILLVDDQLNDQLREIAVQAPPVVSKALESCFTVEESPATEGVAEENGFIQPDLTP